MESQGSPTNPLLIGDKLRMACQDLSLRIAVYQALPCTTQLQLMFRISQTSRTGNIVSSYFLATASKVQLSKSARGALPMMSTGTPSVTVRATMRLMPPHQRCHAMTQSVIFLGRYKGPLSTLPSSCTRSIKPSCCRSCATGRCTVLRHASNQP
jgi:hypothetical protein